MKTLAITLGLGLSCALAAAWVLPRIERPPDRFTLGLMLMDQGRSEDAVHLFTNPEWRGVAEYRAERYRRALPDFVAVQSARSLYNLGNTYARLHEWAGAMAAYDQVLRLDPGHADARHNRDVVARARAAEEALLEKLRNERKMGRWSDGNRIKRESETGEAGKTTAAENREGKGKDADAEVDASGTTANEGLLGKEQRGDEALAGNAPDDEAAATAAMDGLFAAPGPVLLRESEQAAGILLNRIVDDPERVLRARFRAVHRARQDRAATGGQP